LLATAAGTALGSMPAWKAVSAWAEVQAETRTALMVLVRAYARVPTNVIDPDSADVTLSRPASEAQAARVVAAVNYLRANEQFLRALDAGPIAVLAALRTALIPGQLRALTLSDMERSRAAAMATIAARAADNYVARLPSDPDRAAAAYFTDRDAPPTDSTRPALETVRAGAANAIGSAVVMASQLAATVAAPPQPRSEYGIVQEA
jgi:hypothetical protein